MSQQPQCDARRRAARRGGSRCSHSSRLDVPLLELGSSMALQLVHERNGLLLNRACSATSEDRARILRALRDTNADLSKAQACGHCTQLTAKLTESLLHHLLFAKGQLPEPVSLLRKRKEKASTILSASARRRSNGNSSHARKQDKILRKLDQLRQNLEDAATCLAALADNNGEGPSRRPYIASSQSTTLKDLRLLVVMGASATMPREVFVLDLIQSIGRCSITEEVVQSLIDSRHSNSSDADDRMEDADRHLAELLSGTSELQRDAARTKTSGNWERKLVRLLVSDKRLEAFLGSPLAPTKTYLFLSAPPSFRCPGWSARHHLDFDLDHLCGPSTTATEEPEHEPGSTDTSITPLPPSSASSGRKRAPPSPLQGQDRRWHKMACESSSSVASSWPEDSASEQLGESSISSVSDDSRPPSAADKPRGSAGEGWLATCSSPHPSHLCSPSHESHSIETSRTGSSLGSSTVFGHDSNDAVTSSPRELTSSYDDTYEVRNSTDDLVDNSDIKLTEAPATSGPSRDGVLGVRRRSREPKAGGLLSRNLLKAKQSRQNSYAGSDSSSVRSVTSSLKRVPRCAGLQIDFTDPEQAANNASMPEAVDATMQQPRLERCWFQCEAVLEGFR
ncbi:uncharacterized protein SPSC_04771 [Sporisorium scitamineum]|uniref:Uncharacterized protein n=1 Tax=Sporisorium scitamineum TaxID=49012 RepID=A0A0F7S1W5_9BASI|nr:uncharacterized protein SPSC_04771 [Sporisorium scitamineum]CDW95222.1 hypothetical protein [Sporisorium scitamineum]